MFNNGYNSFYPYQNIGAKAGLFSSLRGKFNWSSLLSNTQKTLNIINQAIPVMYQIKPIWNNTKTVFKIIGAVKDDGSSQTKSNTNNRNNNNYNKDTTNKVEQKNTLNNNATINDNTPNFFL